MHLVVLRRNRIEVPDQLPPQLVPKVRNRIPAHLWAVLGVDGRLTSISLC